MTQMSRTTSCSCELDRTTRCLEASLLLNKIHFVCWLLNFWLQILPLFALLLRNFNIEIFWNLKQAAKGWFFCVTLWYGLKFQLWSCLMSLGLILISSNNFERWQFVSSSWAWDQLVRFLMKLRSTKWTCFFDAAELFVVNIEHCDWINLVQYEVPDWYLTHKCYIFEQ